MKRQKINPEKNIKHEQVKMILFIAKFLVALCLVLPGVESVYAQNITTVAGKMKTACPVVPCGDG